MFSGIIESMGKVDQVIPDGSNKDLIIQSNISGELKIDQSLSHNGVCLTVVETGPGWHRVTAIAETLKRSNLGLLESGSAVNLERALLPTTRLDGHMVQGHVDTTATCLKIEEAGGSWYFTFQFKTDAEQHLLVEKGSICVNGVSLTLIDPAGDCFQVAIIPYTYEHTNFGLLQEGDLVNIEYDVIGKYVAAYMQRIKG